jgi:hypothetical protein
MDEIRLLDRDDMNGIDRSATYNWSPEWADRSDRYRDILAYSPSFYCPFLHLFHAKLSETATAVTMFLESCLF